MTAPTTTGATLAAIAWRGARRAPDRAAIQVPGAPALTYAALDTGAARFAARLRTDGARPGDRLILGNGNRPELFIALFGAARAGLIAVPLDVQLAPAELANVFHHARPFAAVVDGRSADAFAALGGARYDADELATGGAPALADDDEGRDEGHDEDDRAAPPRDPDRPALILYTSGTTGTPRGAVHGHAGLQRKLDAINRWSLLASGARAMCMLPTHFGHGLICACLATLNLTGTLVLCRPFDVELLPRVFALADDHAVETFSTVPSIIRLLLRNQAIAPPRAGTLRYVTCASAPLHAEEVAAFEARFGVPLLNCYGITEGGTWSAMSPRDPRARDPQSVGTAVDCRFRAVDGNGDELAAGAVGELQLTGPSVMLGYHEDLEGTARAIRDGWLVTGDRGRVDAAGRVYLAGRSKELIIRAGANIYPAEVEGVLLRHPAIAEAYVLGVAHAVLGEQVAAIVVLSPGAALTARELQEHCRPWLAAYKIPERIERVAAVPRTSRGKVTHAALHALLGAGIGAGIGAGR
jgi:long-chain acyl-CoA synthetase